MIKICEQCLESFDSGHHKNQRFCSHKCAGNARAMPKTCSQCGNVFLGKKTFCSSYCYRSFQDAYYGILIDESGQQIKRCFKCKNVLPLDNFWRQHNSKIGFFASCKHCCLPKYERRKQSESYKRHAQDVGKKPKVRFRHGADSAKRRGYEWKLTFEEYEIFIQLPCHYCGGRLDQCGTGLDRKDNGHVYDLEHCVPCCGRCNTTFMHNFNYQEKLILSECIRKIDKARIDKTVN